MNNNLQGLRGVFAILIVLHHSINWLVAGYCSVSFFFILSGLVTSITYWNKIDSEGFSYTKFLSKRLWKIYPLHLVTLVFSIPIGILSLGWISVAIGIPNLFLIQSWIPLEKIYFSGNALSWYLSDILFFYILSPFLIRLVKGLLTWQLLITFFLVLVLMIMLWSLVPNDKVHSLIYIHPLFRLFDFFTGVVLFRLLVWFNGIFSKSSKNKIHLLEAISILFYIFTLIAFYYCPDRYSYTSLWIVPNSLVILIFALVDNKGGCFSKILTGRLFVLLGKYSFEIFMVHLLCIAYVRIICVHLNINDESIVLVLCYLSILVSVFFVDRYWNPFINKLRNRYEKTNSL